MATTKDYRDYILEQLNLLDNITCKSMMGEYLLYYNGLLFGCSLLLIIWGKRALGESKEAKEL